MQGIDRRARDRIVDFTITHPERYGSLDSYRSERSEFRNLVRSLLPEGWTVGEKPGLWCELHSGKMRVPDGGFKIHLSITHEHARDLLTAVVPVLMEEGVSFKVLVDERILDFSNSTFWGRGACGKFVTIYAADNEQLKRLLPRLHEVTKGFQGPYILSDRRYKDSKVIFYRYGAFRRAQRVNVFGEPVALVRLADGQLVPDDRLPYFALPEGVEDLFSDTEEEEDDDLILKGRYKATSSMGSSSKGGVYRCLDLETNMEVIVKEARPFVNRSRKNPHDAVACLRNEHRVLERLKATGVTPRPIELFQEWEHSFLAMELVKGMPLAPYLARWPASLVLIGEPTAAEVRRYCEEALGIAKKVIAGARAIHAQGVVIQDISPRNILFDPEQGTVTFIDFEAAYLDQRDAESLIIPIVTPGFGVAPRLGEAPTIAGDFKALSRVLGELLYPVTPFFALAPEKRAPLLLHFAKEKGVPEAFVRFFLEMGEQPERVDELLAEAERSITSITSIKPPPPLRSDDDLRKIVGAIGSYIVEQIHSDDDPLDLPVDYRRFVTNPLSAAYGASGVALFLKRTRGEVPEALVGALVREAAKINDNTYAPGLYVGSAGVAWTLLELGMRKEAEALMESAARSPMLFENADLFYGAAGFGLTNLFFFSELGDEKYLKAAVDAFDHIKPKLRRDRGGYCYDNMEAVYHGLAHGAAGIGHFMLQLHRATGQAQHLEVAKGLLDFELASAEKDAWGQVAFRRSTEENLHYPYFRIGSTGIGAVALRFHEALGDDRYLEIARRIARSLAGGYSVFPTNLAGMVGIGNFFVDMHRRTEEPGYMEEARRFVDRVMLFAIEKPSGIVFPGEELVRISVDYGTGSAGTGMFLHRIVAGGGIPYLDF